MNRKLIQLLGLISVCILALLPTKSYGVDDGRWLINYAANGFGGWDWEGTQYGGADAIPVPADYDGDGKADLSVKVDDGRWLIDYAANGFGGWDWEGTQYGGGDARPVPADYDGDGKADLSVKVDDGRWLINYAANGFGGWDWEGTQYGGGDARPVPADYDGDGKADLSVKVDDGRWLINYAANGFGGWDWEGTQYGGGDARPVPADYDGDGKADLSVKVDDGRWLINYAANGFGGWDWEGTQYGGGDARPVPADYDGDGKADLSVKVDDGRWLINYAANGFGGWDWEGTQYGGGDARPVPADYDGDGKADLSVKVGKVQTPTPTPPQPSSFKDNLVRTAYEQWEYFDKGNLKESTSKAKQRIDEYFQSYGAENTGQAWSGAFISWVMRQAGAGNRFEYSSLHAEYISDAVQDRERNDVNAAFFAYRLEEYAPKRGDLVCYPRESGVTLNSPPKYMGHCDVVVDDSRPGEIDVIGGNVSESVTLKTLRVDSEGKLIATDNRSGNYPWFAVLKNRI